VPYFWGVVGGWLTLLFLSWAGETGFHATDVDSDASFGGALQILDKSLRAVSLGIKRLYYHQGTIDQGRYTFAPESGAGS
jgi:hypothetical protein